MEHSASKNQLSNYVWKINLSLINNDADSITLIPMTWYSSFKNLKTDHRKKLFKQFQYEPNETLMESFQSHQLSSPLPSHSSSFEEI